MSKACILLTVALFCLALPTVQAADTLWAGVVLATKEDRPGAIPRSLRRLAPGIAEVFGTNTLYLLGERSKPFDVGVDPWMVPTRDFYFQVKALAREASNYVVNVELYEKQSLLLSSEARLAYQAPLLIRGPMWGRGQIVLVLEIR